jgi:aerobic-type carbon monoxide dehydrogenase small subunit (CoxS/CutS family)
LRPNRATLLGVLRDHLGLNGTKIAGLQFRFSGAATICFESAPKRKTGGIRIAAITA